jgi:hypothetical protein
LAAGLIASGVVSCLPLGTRFLTNPLFPPDFGSIYAPKRRLLSVYLYPEPSSVSVRSLPYVNVSCHGCAEWFTSFEAAAVVEGFAALWLEAAQRLSFPF